MKKFTFFLAGVCLVMASCTKDKTDYEAEIAIIVPEYLEFKNVLTLLNGNYEVRVEALNGVFYKGYNEIRVKIVDRLTKQKVDVSEITFLPISTKKDGNRISSPHRSNLLSPANGDYFSGFAVFTSASGAGEQWELRLSVRIADQQITMLHEIHVEEQTNKNLNMVEFYGKDGQQYLIALVSPQKPKIGENELVAGMYLLRHQSEILTGNPADSLSSSYVEIRNYTLRLDPRMPEPSMGNHSSPNNQDLTQRSDGFYYGRVNYTMTGNWTLNFILLNQQGRIEKGTIVPTDFTPGVEGLKSELFIDILF